MIDLCITGTFESDILEFTIGNETKSIDQFSKSIHFLLNSKQVYRIYFEQKIAQDISRKAEIALNLLFLPIRGLVNILTFNIDNSWEKRISAFRISGYIDISLESDIELTFKYISGSFDKLKNRFNEPKIFFYPKCDTSQKSIYDDIYIRRAHCSYVLNIVSVGIWFYILFLFLLIQSVNYKYHLAFIFLLFVVITFSILIVSLIVKSFKKRRRLILYLSNQSTLKK